MGKRINVTKQRKRVVFLRGQRGEWKGENERLSTLPGLSWVLKKKLGSPTGMKKKDAHGLRLVGGKNKEKVVTQQQQSPSQRTGGKRTGHECVVEAMAPDSCMVGGGSKLQRENAAQEKEYTYKTKEMLSNRLVLGGNQERKSMQRMTVRAGVKKRGEGTGPCSTRDTGRAGLEGEITRRE